MILFLVLLLTVCASVDALRCATCNDPNCANQFPGTCGGGELMCVTASLTVNFTANGTSVQRLVKQCTTFDLCPSLGTERYEADVGYLSLLASVTCCNSDNCNQDNQTFLSPAGSANSLQCFACNSSTSSPCNQTLQCQGNENNCVGATVTSTSISHSAFGCVSSNLCSAFSFLTSFTGLEGTISSGCCDTNLCNRGIPTTPAPSTTTTAATTTTTGSSNQACCVSLSVLHLLLGLILFAAY